MTRTMGLLAALLVAATTPGLAAEERVAARTLPEFAAQKAAIEQALDDGETYTELAPRDRREVHARLARMLGSIEAAGSVDAFTEREKVAFFNEQEAVNALLTQAADDSRLVCRRERPLGSRMMVNTCVTVAERRRRASATQDSAGQLIRQGRNVETGGGITDGF